MRNDGIPAAQPARTGNRIHFGHFRRERPLAAAASVFN
jgi:hypothetical protein